MKNEPVKIGDRVRIIFMQGEPDYTYKEGVVDHIDDAGHIWLDTCGISILPDADIYEVLK